MTTPLATRIDETLARLRADPSAGRTAPIVTAELVNGHARLSSGAFNWDADLGPAVGGENLAPSPTAYLLGALAACAVVFLRDTLAPQFGVTIDGISATARCTSDLGGLLGMDGTSPVLDGIELEVVVRSQEPPERLDVVFAAWRARCPIYLALLRPNQVQVGFESTAGSTSA